MSERETVQPVAKPRRRALRLVLWSFLGLLLVVGFIGISLYRSAGKIPSWYEPLPSDTLAVLEDARRAEGKISELQEWAGARHAYESARRYGQPLAPKPQDELVISFTQDELNSFISKWYGKFGNDLINGMRLSDVFRSPMLRIEKDRVSFGGTATQLNGRVVSLQLQPQVVNGQLQLRIEAIRSGNLTLPEFTWARTRRMLVESLENIASKLAPMSSMDKAGGANIEAVSTALALQGIDSLSGRPTENVLFLPVFGAQAGLPVKLRTCQLDEGVITLTTEPLTRQEQQNLLTRIQRHVQRQPNSVKP